MEKKGYADLRDYINNEYYIINKNKNSEVALKPEKQMLIGYMIEYLSSKYNTMDIGINQKTGIDGLYTFLEKKIENT